MLLVTTTAGSATPAVVAACLTACVTAFTVVTGPV